jgi:hypothetical protein
LTLKYNEVMKILVTTLMVLIFAAPAVAQQVDIRATPPAKERPDFVVPGPYYDVTEPRENPWYPEGVKVPFDPAFVAPLSDEYESSGTRGRYGIAGWTAQNVPAGAGGTLYREQNGWLTFGFAFTWGAAPRPPVRPAATAPRPAPAPAR